MIPWTVAHQAPLSTGSDKDPRVDCHFLLQGIFPTLGSNSPFLHWQADSLLLSHPGSPKWALVTFKNEKLRLWKVEYCTPGYKAKFRARIQTKGCWTIETNAILQSNHVVLLLLLLLSHPVVSDSLQPHGLQHARPPCPSPSPKVCPSLCPLLQWWHLVISSSDALFSFCPQSFPASETFPGSAVCIRWPKYWNFSSSINPSNKYSGLISLKIHWVDTPIKTCMCVWFCVCVTPAPAS